MPEWWEIHLLFFLHNKLLDPECLDLSFADAIEAKMANLANYEINKKFNCYHFEVWSGLEINARKLPKIMRVTLIICE